MKKLQHYTDVNRHDRIIINGEIAVVLCSDYFGLSMIYATGEWNFLSKLELENTEIYIHKNLNEEELTQIELGMSL